MSDRGAGTRASRPPPSPSLAAMPLFHIFHLIIHKIHVFKYCFAANKKIRESRYGMPVFRRTVSRAPSPVNARAYSFHRTGRMLYSAAHVVTTAGSPNHATPTKGAGVPATQASNVASSHAWGAGGGRVKAMPRCQQAAAHSGRS